MVRNFNIYNLWFCEKDDKRRIDIGIFQNTLRSAKDGITLAREH